MDQREAWESFYSDNHRPWRGVSDLKEVPFPPGGRILEVGCGNGKTALALSKKGYSVTGVDFSRSAIEMCLSSCPDAGDFLCASVTDLPFDDSAFDGAVAFHVLEHLEGEELMKAVNELFRVVRPGSHLLIRCFAKGDMRSGKGEAKGDAVVRGNGISYHYYDEDELLSVLGPFECVTVRTVEDRTRFGTVRRRIEADMIRPLG